MKKIMIIGGGIAGISAGIFLQKKGCATVIYEKNDCPGGVCICPSEKGFHFDLSCRLLNGIKSGRRYGLMCETGAVFPGLATESSLFEIYQNEGEIFRVEWNLRAFRKLLDQLCASEDERRIGQFFETVGKFYRLSQDESAQPFRLLSLKGKWEFLRKHGAYAVIPRRIVSQSFEQWINGWQSGSVRRLWRALYPDNYALSAFFAYAAARLYGNSGRPVGGSKALVHRLTETYLGLGGRLETGSPVDEILLSDGRVAGVRIGNRTETGTTVVAACDIGMTLGKLLQGRVKISKAVTLLRHGDLFYPLLTVCYGLNRRFGIPDTLLLEDEKGVDASPDLTNNRIEIHSLEAVSGTAPPGKSALIVNLRCDWYFWKNLREKSGEAYRQYKLMVVDELNACMERRFPGFTDSVELTKVLTPLSYERFSVLNKGSWRGFAPTVFSMKNRIPHFGSSCKGLYFCGQSIAVGGGIDAVTEDAFQTAEWIAARERF